MRTGSESKGQYMSFRSIPSFVHITCLASSVFRELAKLMQEQYNASQEHHFDFIIRPHIENTIPGWGRRHESLISSISGHSATIHNTYPEYSCNLGLNPHSGHSRLDSGAACICSPCQNDGDPRSYPFLCTKTFTWIFCDLIT